MADLETTTAAARAVNLSKWFLYRHADKIPAAHRAGRALRWDTPKLKEWMREQAELKASSANGHPFTTKEEKSNGD